MTLVNPFLDCHKFLAALCLMAARGPVAENGMPILLSVVSVSVNDSLI
jgi:hypothetical protein